MAEYSEAFRVGQRVRVTSRAALDRFRDEWQLHNPLTDEQLAFADRPAVVREVGFYHGGDALYVLQDLPGLWHEPCLVEDL